MGLFRQEMSGLSDALTVVEANINQLQVSSQYMQGACMGLTLKVDGGVLDLTLVFHTEGDFKDGSPKEERRYMILLLLGFKPATS